METGYTDDEGELCLYVKDTETGKVLTLKDPDFKPYFYVIGRKPEIEGALSVEKDEKGWKITVRNPSDVPKLRENAKKFGEIREYDIPFTQRYLIDKDISPMKTYEWTAVDGHALSHRPIDAAYHLDVLSWDIETYNPKGMPRPEQDPIVMISLHDGHEGRVLTWKKIKKKYVETYDDEKSMIEAFIKYAKHADVLVTYNGDNFDLPYVKTRMEQLNIPKEDLDIKVRKGMQGTKCEVRGQAHLDAYKGMRFLATIGKLSLPRYTLEDAYAEFTGKEKLDINVKKLHEIWDTGKGIEELAEYSFQDAEAGYVLGDAVLALYIELAKLTNQTLFNASRSTTSQLVEALLTKKAFKRGELAPNKPGEGEAKKRMAKPIKGAFVKQPEPGLHENLAVLDYRGLYPSIIISHNIDPTALGGNGFVAPTGQKFAKEPEGLIPEMLREVTSARAKVKEHLKKARKGTLEHRILDARQHSLKIIANATYGYMNFARARWHSRDCAEATTAWGRHYVSELITKAQAAGFGVLYADSVTSERFVTLLNRQGIVEVKNIEELFEENKDRAEWRGPKQVITLKGWKALTVDPRTQEPRWATITQIIRHKAKKRILRVNQKHGETRVTEDHSLIIRNGNEFISVKADELKDAELARVESLPAVKKIDVVDVYETMKSIEYEITYKGRKKLAKAHADSDWVWFGWTNQKKKVKVKRFIHSGTKEFKALCRLLGAYIAEGSASTRETTKTRNGASIASSDTKWLRDLQKDYQTLFGNALTCVIRSTKKKRTIRTQSKVIEYDDRTHKMQMMNEVSAVFFKAFCGQKSRGKSLPSFIYHADDKYKRIMLEKMIDGDGTRTVNEKLGYTEDYKKKNFKYNTSSLKLISGLSLLLTQLGQKHTIQYRPSKQAYSIITSSKYNRSVLTKLTEEAYTGYVYDLSIENSHMFVDSCGQVLLHNTDSSFLQRGNKPKQAVLDFLEEYNKSLPHPMEVELKGFYPRGIFVTRRSGEGAAKKRYALIREDGAVEITGLEFVRRDWSELAKRTQAEVIRSVLEGDVNKAKQIVLQTIANIRENKVPIEEYVVYTQLKQNIGKYDAVGPHVRAAKRLKDAGEEAEKGSVIGYVVCKGAGNVGDRAWPMQLIGNKQPDPEYYIDHQVLPAVMKILHELGIKEADLKVGGKQSGLHQWF